MKRRGFNGPMYLITLPVLFIVISLSLIAYRAVISTTTTEIGTTPSTKISTTTQVSLTISVSRNILRNRTRIPGVMADLFQLALVLFS